MKFKVTITETLQKTAEVEAQTRDEAEQMVSDQWRNSDNILDADNFVGVEFTAVPLVEPKAYVQHSAGEKLANMDKREFLEAIKNYLFTQNGDTIPHPIGFEEDLLDDVAGALMDMIDFLGKSESVYAEESDKQRDFCKSIWNALRYAVCVGAAVERGDLTLK